MRPGAPQAAPRPAPTVLSIGEYRLARSPERLVIYGLGSCVAVLLHEPGLAASCLGHILLPGPARSGLAGHAGRFASSAIPEMLALLRDAGGDPEGVVAKVVGGAEMFRYERPGATPTIGRRNVEAALAELGRLEIPVVAQDTAGTHGRTLLVDAASGTMEVRALRLSVRRL